MRWMRLGFLTFGWAMIVGVAPGWAAECLKPAGTWLQLSQSPVCRGRWVLADRPGSLCLGEDALRAWLAAQPTEAPLCFEGRWRARAKIRNDPDAPAKKARLEFLAERWLGPRAEARSARPVGVRSWLQRARRAWERERLRLSELLEPGDGAGILRSLLLGESAGDLSGLLRQLGLVHVFAATGIHLYAVTGWVRWSVGALGSVTGLPVTWGVALARGASRVAWLGLWLLSGARPGMLRPLLVLGLRSGGEALGLRWRPLAPLGVSLALDGSLALVRALQGNPEAWAPGRWLYAAAVGGGLMALQHAQRNGRSGDGPGALLREHAAMAWGSWVLLGSVEALQTGRVAPFTPVLSLVTVPLLASFAYPLAGCAWLLDRLGEGELAARGARAAGAVAGGGVELVLKGALAVPAVWVVPAAAVGAAAVLAAFCWGRRLGWAVWLGLAALRLGVAALRLGVALAPTALLAAPGAMATAQVEQLDVGQGDSAWVRGASGVGLLDTGGERSLGASGWIEFLGRERVARLDWIALTHLDEDHAGGVKLLADLLPVGCVVSSDQQWTMPRGEQLVQRLRDRGVRVGSFERGECFPYGVLLPSRPTASGGSASLSRRGPVSLSRRGPVSLSRRGPATGPPNAAMSGVWIPLARGGHYVNFGDADARAEEPLAAQLPARVLGPPLILKATHHGSATASGPGVLARLRPTEVWVSAGVGNRYGHPSLEALDRYRAVGARVRRTDQEGLLRRP